MVLQHLRTLLTKPVSRLSLDETIDKICRLTTPVPWDFCLPNFDLFWENMVSDFFSVLAVIWSFTEHTLICDYTHCEIINSNAVILTAHDLWCHIAWRSGRVFRVLRIPQPCNTQISNSKVTIFVEDQIFRLDISMQDCILMKVLETKKHARDKEFYIKRNRSELKITVISNILLVCSSVNRRCLPIWYLRSPPDIRSITR